MTKRIVVWGLTLLVILTLAIITAAQRKADLPPGVLPEMWITINQNAGVALNYEGSRYSPHPALTHGMLWIRSHGSWTKVYLDPAPEGGFVPVTK